MLINPFLPSLLYSRKNMFGFHEENDIYLQCLFGEESHQGIDILEDSKQEWDPINSNHQPIEIKHPEFWASFEEQPVLHPKEEPPLDEMLEQMKKARENQKKKIQKFMNNVPELKPLKLMRKSVSETDDSSVGSPRKKVKRIAHV